MTRNWYAVYTRPQKERKVSQFLNRKGIENFCPAMLAVETKCLKRKEITLPLFNSLVFVHLSEPDARSISSIPWVINFLYWRSKPAVISDSEIDIVKKLSSAYDNIRLEKSPVEVDGSVKVFDEPAITYNENSVSVKYKSIKVSLPSLGFIVTADRAEKKAEVYQPSGIFASFPKRLNALFFN